MGARHFLFGVQGRLGRRGFWLYLAIALPLLTVLLLVFWAYSLSLPGAYENGGPTPFPSDPLGIAGAMAFFGLLGLILIAGACVAIRRLHDRDKAGWWLLLVIALNSLFGWGAYLADTGVNAALGAVPRLGSAGLLLWCFTELALLRGTAGPNRFGPDPLKTETAD